MAGRSEEAATGPSPLAWRAQRAWVGIAGIGVYVPPRVETAEAIAAKSGIPEPVVREKMGLRKKHVAGPEEHLSNMGVWAAREALAGTDPLGLDVVVFHGSEYKDYIVWSAASRIQYLLGARRAFAFEIYGMCVGGLVAMKVVADMMASDPAIRRALLVTASREGDLVSYRNPRARFMYNFGAGGAAALLVAGHPRLRILGYRFMTDGSFSLDVIMPAGGTRMPPSEETVRQGLHQLDVPDPEGMKRRLDPVSLPNFLTVIRGALEMAGRRPDDVALVVLNHMKRSFHEAILREMGLGLDRSIYLEDYGHVQSVDQFLGLKLALAQGRLRPGDVVVLAGAGTGYTWGAVVLEV